MPSTIACTVDWYSFVTDSNAYGAFTFDGESTYTQDTYYRFDQSATPAATATRDSATVNDGTADPPEPPDPTGGEEQSQGWLAGATPVAVIKWNVAGGFAFV